jgi:tetratricopeptide (TPR) repeat protein
LFAITKALIPRQYFIFMATNRPKSPKERRDAKNARSFIGRTEQQDQFQRSLLQPEHQDAKLIFGISGQGGVGKTTLLKEFRRIAESFGHVVAYVDEGVATNRVDDVPEAMHRLAEDLEGQGFKFDEFRKRYKDYRVKKQEMEADPEAPKGFVGDATRGVMKMALEAGKSAVPFGSMIDSEMVASKAGELMNYGVERFRNKDEERLIKETLEVLTPLFLEGVKRLPVEKTLVLMLDTYEVTGAFLDAWIRGVLEEKYGESKELLLVCIGGREPIDKNAWDEWESVIGRSPLEPFTREEAEDFLASKQIKSGAVIEEIWRLSSGGLPLLVSMMAAAAPTSADAVVDPCADAVNRFLVWETDGARRDLAQDAACARVLNADVVAALGEGSFEWLSGCAFVLRDGARWRYHLVVREQMLRYLGQRSPRRYGEVHGRLAAYYDGLRNGLGLEVGKEAEDETWREYSLEWIYHELSAAPQAKLGLALNGFLVALKESQLFAQTWATVMVQSGQETKFESLRKWGDQLENGMKALRRGTYADVIPCLTAILDAKQVDGKLKAVAFYERGSMYICLGNLDKSVLDLEQATGIEKDIPVYYIILGITYNGQSRYEEATTAYLKAIELNPQDATVYYHLGEAYSDHKNYAAAIAAYQRAIELNPKNALVYYKLGVIYDHQKRYEEAITVYQSVVELNPEHAAAYNNLGVAHKTQKRYEEAIIAYQQAIALNSEYGMVYYNLGNTYYAQKRYEEAITVYQRAIELNPEYDSIYIHLGNTYDEQKRYKEAIMAYQRAIELNPENVAAHNNLGITYYNQKRYEEAIMAYQYAIELNSENATAYYNLGIAYKAQKLYEKAVKAYQRAIKLNPEDAIVYSNLGNIYKILERYDDALKNSDRAIEIDPENELAYYLRALTNIKLNQSESANPDFQKAITIAQLTHEKDPTNHQNTFNLALYHLAAANQAESDRLYTTTLTAPKEWLEMAISDLDDFLHLFPDHSQAQQVRSMLQEAIV